MMITEPAYHTTHVYGSSIITKVIVIFSEWIHERLSNLEPSHVEEELQNGEHGKVYLDLLGKQNLPTDQTDQKIAVGRYCHHLKVN